MKVHWTDTALRHLDAIHAYIAGSSTQYADGIVDRLTRRSIQIAAFPESGRMVPEFDVDDVREVIENPYRIIYRLKQDQVDILAVFHSREQLPESLD